MDICDQLNLVISYLAWPFTAATSARLANFTSAGGRPRSLRAGSMELLPRTHSEAGNHTSIGDWWEAHELDWCRMAFWRVSQGLLLGGCP